MNIFTTCFAAKSPRAVATARIGAPTTAVSLDQARKTRAMTQDSSRQIMPTPFTDVVTGSRRDT